jgi:hypothetical protein
MIPHRQLRPDERICCPRGVLTSIPHISAQATPARRTHLLPARGVVLAPRQLTGMRSEMPSLRASSARATERHATICGPVVVGLIVTDSGRSNARGINSELFRNHKCILTTASFSYLTRICITFLSCVSMDSI